LTVPECVSKYRLVGATNASMYRMDHRTSVFYMRNGPYRNNNTWYATGSAVFATNRLVRVAPHAVRDAGPQGAASSSRCAAGMRGPGPARAGRFPYAAAEVGSGVGKAAIL
jgi:hypothetical protein